MTLIRPNLPDQVYTPTQFIPEDQATALSQEILNLSQKSILQPAEQTTLPAPATDRLPLSAIDKVPLSQNAAVDKLPSLTLEEQPKPVDAKLSFVANAAMDIGFGAGAIVVGEVIAGILTKNPEFEAMALQTFQAGGKMALLTSPTFLAPYAVAAASGFGVGAIGRHYTFEELTGKSESWMDSGEHITKGAASFLVGRYVGKQFPPLAPRA